MMRRSRWIIGLIVFLLAPAWAAAANKYVLVKANSLTLRSKPSTKSKALEKLITYKPLEIIESKGKKWRRVKTPTGKTGWVLSSYLTKHAFVWIDHKALNVRRGPGTEYAILFKLEQYRHYPLRVLDVARNGWLKVMDFEGDRGWVHYNLIKSSPSYVIARLDKPHNIRKGPGVEHEEIFQALPEYIFEVLGEDKGWLKVKATDGDIGWISSKIVFGWRDVAPPAKKPKNKKK
jgi:SH3-like domain-containing protein